jgi:lactoylglutathione lyase
LNLAFVTIHTVDLESSVAFYEKVLGFKTLRRFSPRPGMTIVFVADQAGRQLEFIQDEKGSKYQGQGISLGFLVEDIRATEALLKRHGVANLQGPFELGNGGKMLTARDLNGLELGFVQEPAARG